MVDSVIVLYESTETEFLTNGIGYLPDAISCTVTEERNGEYELEMEYPITGKRYSDISLRKIISAKSNPHSDRQPFRIYSISKPMNGVVTINAEHISYDTIGIPVSPFTADAVESAFLKIKQNTPVDCPFTFWTDMTTKATMEVVQPVSIRSLLGGSSGSILDIYGGEYEFDKYTIKLHNHRGANRGVSIRYGKNLTDLTQEENCSAVFTGVYPFWYSEQDGIVTLDEKILYAEGTYNFTRIYPLDLSQDFQEKPTQPQLKERAEEYMEVNDIGIPKVSLDVSFIQLAQSEEYKDIALLEDIYLCDTVNVEFPELGVSATAKCIKTVYNALTNKYDKIELGDAKSNLETTITEQKKEIEEVPSKTFLEQAVENATMLITGGLGGYVVIHSSTGDKHPDELLIMDTDDIKTAKKVWRWNKGGLGYSKTGYNGPYTTAVTADGQIVADFITAGEFNGAIIKAGTITADLLSIEYKKSVKSYADSVGTNVTKELTTLIENTANSIRLLCRSIEEQNMHNYVVGGDFEDGFTDEWYVSNATNNVVLTVTGLGKCARILKNSTTSSYIRCNLGPLAPGTYRLRFKAATSAGHEDDARVQSSLFTSSVTPAGLLKSDEFTTIERDITITTSSTSNRYLYLYANVQNAPIYVKDVEVLGVLRDYAEAQIQINADNITNSVKKNEIASYITQYYDRVIVAFNNDSKYVQIAAGAISIYDNGVTDSKRRAMFDQNGNHFYRDGYYVGKIGTNQWQDNTSHKGLVFDLEYQGKYMTWGILESPSADIYTSKFTYSRANSIYSTEGLHAGCDLDMHNYTLKNVAWPNGGITQTINFVQVLEMNSDGTVARWGANGRMVFTNGILTDLNYYV